MRRCQVFYIACATEKTETKCLRTLIVPPEALLESVCIDILEEFIKIARGNEYPLLIVDRLNKSVKTVTMKGQSVAEVAKSLANSSVFNYVPSKDLIADSGKCFTSTFFQSVCQIIVSHNSFTKTYHHQMNGQVERYSRSILSTLRMKVADHLRIWDLQTDALTYA